MNKLFLILGIVFSLTACSDNALEVEEINKLSPNEAINNENNSDFLMKNHSQEIEIYTLGDLEDNTKKKIGFVSLSDNYPLSYHPDSLAIPDLTNVTNPDELLYFNLEEKYRKRFLTAMNVLESDSLFIYDFSNNILLSFLVKSLTVSANLSVYSYGEPDGYAYTQDDYEIGFGVEKHLLKNLDMSNSLVVIDKVNPFQQGYMKPIVWVEINPNEFPSLSNTQLRQKQTFGNEKTYRYTSNEYQYYAKTYSTPAPEGYVDETNHIQLVIIDKATNELIVERIYSDSEGVTVTPLNYGNNNSSNPEFQEQWTGKLFKDKPPVIFGFEWVSFDCPSLTFLDSQKRDLYINCDNRH